MGSPVRVPSSVPLHFHWVREARPGAAWKVLFESTWPSYERWFLSSGDDSRPDLAASLAALEQYMPELLPIWSSLVELAGGNERAARMLSMFRPAPYVTGCSQAVWSGVEPLLVRNYDYHPKSCEGVFLHSAWNGVRTLVASDCLWGVLDGMNEHGLVVSLAFGGRRRSGDGFGIPLILRYILETCSTTAEGIAVLQRVPSHMAYNVSLLDASGERAVVAVAPDYSTTVEQRSVATNHLGRVPNSRYARVSRSQERFEHLERLLADESLTRKEFVQQFLRAPLYNTRYGRGFGTLYTAVYNPRRGTVRYLWPTAEVTQSLVEFAPRELRVELAGTD